MKKCKLAVIGYGGMGGWHVQHALDSDVVELAGIYDILPEKRQLAESRGIHAYNSYEEVLADPAVELLTVAIPNDQHESVCIRGLEAGKNVISEKPVTLDTASLQRMFDAADKAGRLFTVHQNRRWDVDFLAMKHLKETGELGDFIRIESRIHGSRGIPSDWRGIKQYGGGGGIPQFPGQINNVELRPIGIRIQPRLAAVLRITVVPDPAGLPLVSDPTIRQRPRCCIITKGVQADNGL